MKLLDIIEFKIPLTVVSLRAWPSPTKGEQHSGIDNMMVDPTTGKVKIPKHRKLKKFMQPVKESVDDLRKKILDVMDHGNDGSWKSLWRLSKGSRSKAIELVKSYRSK